VLPVLALVGPTASGKSALAMEVARTLIGEGRPVEIVNADAMLVYKGMDIGTAKPSAAERAEVPHHMIDLLEVTETASVAEFQKLARAAIAELRGRGVVPLVVGGSALYMRAVLDELAFPATDPQVRAKWEAELARVGPQALHAELARRAPDAAAGILPGNGRRIVRALEVVELTGAFVSVLPDPAYAVAGVSQFGLDLPREALDVRIAERARAMWEAGLVDEVRSLIPKGLRQGLTARKALGYAQALAYLDGELSEEAAITQTAEATRRFARKQLAWWRRDPRIAWLDAGAPGGPDAGVLVSHGRIAL
jgi:tRNA dimethylallyltransferase